MEIKKNLSILKKKLLLQYIKIANRSSFNTVERYCMFVGYPRSGHSLIGSLLNAHPQIVISHELDALNYLQHSNRNILYANILYKDYIFGRQKRNWCGYSYLVPNSFQGKFDSLKVIGDKKGGGTASHLHQNPQILQKLEKVIQIPIHIIHVMRNPYDMISRHSIAFDRELRTSMDQYFKNFKVVSQHYGVFNWFDLYHEDFIANPQQQMTKLLQFLNVSYTQSFLDNIQSLVFSSPKKSREKVHWLEKDIKIVAKEIQKYHYFSRYSFTN